SPWRQTSPSTTQTRSSSRTRGSWARCLRSISPPTRSPRSGTFDHRIRRPAMSSYLPRETARHRHALIALSLIAALSACTAGQDKGLPAKPTRQANSAANDQKATVAKGETVTELDKAIFYILQAKDNTYWFGSDGRG